MAKDMKRRDVETALNRNGCGLLRTDGIHDVYGCPCGQHRLALPRHRTVSPGVVRKAMRDLGCLPKGWLQ